jgi:hypothetical protein
MALHVPDGQNEEENMIFDSQMIVRPGFPTRFQMTMELEFGCGRFNEKNTCKMM